LDRVPQRLLVTVLAAAALFGAARAQPPSSDDLAGVRYNSTFGRYEFGLGDPSNGRIRLARDGVPENPGGADRGSTTGSTTGAATPDAIHFGTRNRVTGTLSSDGGAANLRCNGADCSTNIYSQDGINLFSGGMSNVSRLMQNGTVTLVPGPGLGSGRRNPASFWHDVHWQGASDSDSGAIVFIRDTDRAVAPKGVSQILAVTNYESGFDGGRTPWWFVVNKTAASRSGNNVFGGLNIHGHYDAGEGGTPGNYKGGFVLMNPDIRCSAGCDWVEQVMGMEFDIRLFRDKHVNRKVIMGLHYATFDAEHGATTDATINISAFNQLVPGTGGTTVALLLGEESQAWPFDPTLTASSKIIGIAPSRPFIHPKPIPYYLGYGIDIKEAYIAQYAWRSSGFWVDGGGQIFAGPGAITYTSTGLNIGTPNVAEIAAVPAAGGRGYQVGDQVADPIWGLWNVSAVGAGGAVTGLTQLRPGYAAACPPPASATTLGNGAGMTITVTCATRQTLELGGAGQSLLVSTSRLGFYGARPIARPTPSGSCAGNSGCQTLRDTLGQLGLIDPRSISN